MFPAAYFAVAEYPPAYFPCAELAYGGGYFAAVYFAHNYYPAGLWR